MLPALSHPCAECPFRHPSLKFPVPNKTLDKWAAKPFPCHCTRQPVVVLVKSGDGVGYVPTESSRQCAGALFFKENGIRYRA